MDKEKLEDVKEGLRRCIDNDCAGCPYITLCLDEGRQFAALAKDALELLNEKFPEAERVEKVAGLYFCPGCLRLLQTLNHQKHCDRCGKELIWK